MVKELNSYFFLLFLNLIFKEKLLGNQFSTEYYFRSNKMLKNKFILVFSIHYSIEI